MEEDQGVLGGLGVVGEVERVSGGCSEVGRGSVRFEQFREVPSGSDRFGEVRRGSQRFPEVPRGSQRFAEVAEVRRGSRMFGYVRSVPPPSKLFPAPLRHSTWSLP
mgnify:CR=1 FL=1